MRAADLMTTEVETLPATATIAEAVRLITEHEVRHVPLVGPEGELVAVLSDRDLRRVDGLLARQIGEADDRSQTVLDAPATTLVGGEPIAVRADAHVDDLIDLFLSERLGALVVTDDEDRVVGIVSVLDVLAAAKGRL